MKTFLLFMLIAGSAALTGGVVHDIKAQAAAGGLKEYDTLEEAGVHAIQRDYECSLYYECGGVIAQTPSGKYVIGPVTSSFNGDEVDASYKVPEGYKAAAGHHTHPCLPDSHYPEVFSPTDISNAVFKHVPEFMGDLCSGAVHEFDPLKDKPDDVVLEGHGYVSAGRVIGHIPGPFKMVEPNTGF